MSAEPFLQIVSVVLGWAYVLCWSISLYPPVLLTHRLKSVEGMSIDFVFMNTIGYLTYALSMWLLYFSTTVRSEYAQRHSLSGSGELSFPLVRFNDVAYGCHGALLVSILFYQCNFCGYTRGSTQHLSRGSKLFLSGLMFFIVLFTAMAHYGNKQTLQLYDLTVMLGNVKVIMSASKYIPQVLYNRSRKSTKGWSIAAIKLDVTGGILSLSQLFLDGYLKGELRGVLNNSIKLLLATITLFFDAVFALQHYYFYPESESNSLELEGMGYH